MEIKLRYLGHSGLINVYSRRMGDSKIKHYHISIAQALINKMEGKTDLDVLKEYIEKTEGLKDINITIEQSGFPDLSKFGNSIPLYGYNISLTDISKTVLKDEPVLFKELLKVKSNGTLYTSLKEFNVLEKIYNKIVNTYNKVVKAVNSLTSKLPEFLNIKLPVTPNILQSSTQGFTHYISICFEAEDTKEAINALISDLKILLKKKLILGHLAMPSIMPVTNTVGAGNFYCIFCFPLLDSERVRTLTGEKIDGTLKLSSIGLKYEIFEGGISKWLNDVKPTDMFEVEEVNLYDSQTKEIQQQVLDSFNKSRDLVNEVSKKMRKKLKKSKVRNSRSSTTVGGTGSSGEYVPTKVKVDVDLVDDSEVDE